MNKGPTKNVIKEVVGMGFRRFLIVIFVVIIGLTLFAVEQGRDCESGSTEEWSPDIEREQVVYLNKNFPEQFVNKIRADEELLSVIRFVDRTRNDAPLVFLDVGANVGRTSFHFLREWGHEKPWSVYRLYEQASGTLPDRKQLLHKLKLQGDEPRTAVVHAFEVDQHEFQGLENVARQLQPAGSLVVHQVAVVGPDQSGQSAVPLFSSSEGTTLGRPSAQAETVATVDGLSVDAFLDQQEIERVHVVKIDVEGFETNVIAGMKRSMQLKKVQAFLFDYGHKWRAEYTGRPTSFALADVVGDLYSQHQFICYLVSRHRLLRLSPPYWDENFELHQRHKFVNVVVFCAHADWPLRGRVVQMFNAPYWLEDPFD